jgi:glycosyltransferase involved in cell wall biosynthesis
MRGLVSAFKELGLDVVTADISGVAGDIDRYGVRQLSLGTMPEGVDADLVFAMKPSMTMARLVASGHKLVGLHVGDVSEIPHDWQLTMAREELVVVPSNWMQQVVRNAIGDDVPVCVSNHGIEQAYIDAEPAPPPPPGEPFKWLHFCSAGVYPERKGTPEALRAFERLVRAGHGGTFTLVIPELRRRLKRFLGALDADCRDRVLVTTQPMGLSSTQMIKLYQDHHALLAPSRAEGFGIQPLEARAVGRPVVQTLCTGFRDGCPPTSDPGSHGVIEVAVGEFKPAWGDFGEAPEVTVSDVAEAMQFCMKEYTKIQAAAENCMPDMRNWSWTTTTRSLARKLREVGK